MRFRDIEKFLDDWKFSQGIRPGLSRIQALLKKLGNPHKKFQAIHVVGTNGKGTVAYCLHQILMANGIKTGLYTSPHLLSYRERFVIDDRPISKPAFEKFFNRVWEVSKSIKKITEFEVLTGMAILWFAQQKIEVAVMEAGLGGRFDATNIFDFVLTIVPSISEDHKNILGSLPQIYFEKLAVLKNSRATLIGEVDAKLLQKTLNRLKLNPKRIVLYRLPRSTTQSNFEYNRLLAQTAGVLMNLPGLPKRFKSLPGRMEILSRKPLIVFDAAHNARAMRNLVQDLKKCFPGKRFEYFLGILKRKDAPRIISYLPGRLHQVPVQGETPYKLTGLKSKRWIDHPSFEDALDWIKKNKNIGNVYVFTGSFYGYRIPKKRLKTAL